MAYIDAALLLKIKYRRWNYWHFLLKNRRRNSWHRRQCRAPSL
nr:MAG TPA: hypothetical protein [Caudoviricetes sp.]